MNSFGGVFRIGIFGESHGESVGVTVDGCPAGLPLHEDDFREDLSRRRSRPGIKGTTPRREPDLPRFLSGIFKGKSTGAPITIIFENTDTRGKDYEKLKAVPRPGHADFTAGEKYGGFNDYRGGGHFSGRLTLGLVAAGVIAKKIIRPVSVRARLVEVGGDRDIEGAVARALEMKDSIGGLVECEAQNVPIGLGEPFFDSLESLVSHLIFAIPGIKGIDFGSGFAAARMRGSEHNDPIIDAEGRTETNHAGGINGGISNGNPIRFRVAVKPTSSIAGPQYTFDLETGKRTELQIEGRHDTCIALRVPVIVESALAVVLADLSLLEQRVPRTVQGTTGDSV